MSDRLQHGHRFRTLNVLDDFNHEILGIEIDSGLGFKRVTRYLDQIAAWRGYPDRIRVDNGSEFTSHEFAAWAKTRSVMIDFIKPGSPYQNGIIERFNKTFREDILDACLFDSIDHAQQMANRWIREYNEERPHQVLSYQTPLEYATA